MLTRRELMAAAIAAAGVSVWPGRSEADEATFDSALAVDRANYIAPPPRVEDLPPAPTVLGKHADFRLPPAPQPLFALTEVDPEVPAVEKRLHLFNTHTAEELEVVFFRDGYLDKGLTRLNHFMRDWRTEAVTAIDPLLFDLLHQIRADLDVRKPFCILSAYRTAETNAMLARVNPHVARRSLHIAGRAVDVFVPGCALEALRDKALALRVGGVGYYPDNGFIHLDTGPVRTWS